MTAGNSLYEVFFQKNRSYYLEKLEKYRNGQRFSFNIFAFLFGFLWFAYRRMYVEAFLIVGFLVVEGALELYLLEGTPDEGSRQMISWFITLIVWTITGFIANYLYLRKAERIVARAVHNEADQERAAGYVRRKGGTSYFFLVFIIAIVAIFFLYTNYGGQSDL